MSIRKKIVRALQLATFLTLLTGAISLSLIKIIDLNYNEMIHTSMPQLEHQRLIDTYIIEETYIKGSMLQSYCLNITLHIP